MPSLQTMLGDVAKANQLFDRLAETTAGAIKTRASLLGELKVELDAHARLEQAHLLPALRKHAQTRALADAAAERLGGVRELIARIGREPMDGEAFVGKVKELKTLFQAHLRDEKSELLPAMKKTLTDAEAVAVADRISAAKTAAEAAQKAAADTRRAEARRLREKAEAREAALAAAERAGRKAAADAREATASGMRAADKLTRQVAAGVAEASSDLARTITRLAETAPTAPAALQGVQGVTREWIHWVQARAQNQRQGLSSLARCRTPFELAAAHARLVREDVALMMESGARIYQAASRSAPRPS